MSAPSHKVPVTVLTGFLGAGKTTLLNRILSEPHGKKYAVIVNEFGEIGIDNELIVSSDEEIFEMSNGCVCCTVRGDLIRVIGGLLRRAGGFDGILLETTGLADPAPVAQTFFTDRDIAARAKLDSVMCVADALHLPAQLEAGPEPENQIAFADIIILNKTDCVTPEVLDDVESAIRAINPLARLIRASRGNVALADILGQGGFDLDKILEKTPDFLAAEETKAHSDACGCGCCGHDHEHHHEHAEGCGCGCAHDHAHHAPAFRHATDISSVSIATEHALDGNKIQNWLADLAATKGGDLLRYKGILNLDGEDNRIVIQGVHMMMEGGALAPWPEGMKRQSRMVFIGHKLNEKELRDGFMGCVK